MGWEEEGAPWLQCSTTAREKAHELLLSTDVLISSEREIDVFEERARRGLTTYYTSERWFKPPFGRLRLLFLPYLKMAWRFRKLVRGGGLRLLPIGIHAASDFLSLLGYDRQIWNEKLEPAVKLNGFDWLRLWGYFVAPTDMEVQRRVTLCTEERGLRILWVGRFLDLKRVETLVKAVSFLLLHKIPITLTLVGDGPCRERIERLVKRVNREVPSVVLLHSVSIHEVRKLMRVHDVYVLPSNGYEGWGAVVCEALEEGMIVLGTHEAGASATLLPQYNLFRTGDWRGLAGLLLKVVITPDKYRTTIGRWNARDAAQALLKIL